MTATLRPTFVGRSNSRFIRLTRIFAVECDVLHAFEIIPRITSLVATNYAGNSILKIPILKRPNHEQRIDSPDICRWLAYLRSNSRTIIGAESIAASSMRSVCDLTTQAMTTAASIAMARNAQFDDNHAYMRRLHTSLEGSFKWLKRCKGSQRDPLTKDGTLSSFEFSIYYRVQHRMFRQVAGTTPYFSLQAFCKHVVTRFSAVTNGEQLQCCKHLSIV